MMGDVMRLILAIAVAATLSASPMARAETPASPVLAAAEAFCLRDHAIATRVLADADAAGWTPIAGAGPNDHRLLDMFGMVANPNVRLKTDGEDHLMLRVHEVGADTSPAGLISRSCDVADEGPGSPSLHEEVRRLMNAAPSTQRGALALWYYSEGPQGRRLLSEAEATHRTPQQGEVLVALAAFESPLRPMIQYYELTRAEK